MWKLHRFFFFFETKYKIQQRESEIQISDQASRLQRFVFCLKIEKYNYYN